MPKIIKKKVVEKKGVQDDEVKSYALEAVEAIKKKQRQVITVAVVLAVVLASYMIFTMYSASKKADAVAIEMEANGYYYGDIADTSMSDEARLKKALALYKESLDKAVTLSALYNLGNTYYKLGDYENAVIQYEAVIDEFGGNEEMDPLVYQKMAASYIRTGKNDKAFEALGKLAKVSGGIFRDTALVLEARYLESAGETEKSLQKYLELASEYPDSMWRGEAASKLPKPEEKSAGAAPEEVIEDKPEEVKKEEPAKGEE